MNHQTDTRVAAGMGLFFLLVFALDARAQEVSASGADLLTAFPMDRIVLPIGGRGQTIEVLASAPHNYDPRKAHPLLVVLDADPLLGLLKTINFLWAEEGRAEAAILVGVPWGATGDLVWANRSYYLLPKRVGTIRYYEQEVPVNNGGGAPELAAFLAKELLPRLRQEYNVDGDRLGLVGFSMGGLFAAWHLVFHPGVFSDYIVLSPPLAAPFVGPELMEASRALRKRGFERTKRLYLAYGEYDLEAVRIGAPAWGKIWESPAAANLVFRSEVIEEHRHDSSAVPGLINGYEFLFGR